MTVKLNRVHGPFRDIKALLPDWKVKTVFDIGANKGQTAEKFLHHFGNIQIFCFEPAAEAFKPLIDAFADQPHIHCRNIALSNRIGKETMLIRKASFVNCFEEFEQPMHGKGDYRKVEVNATTLDAFCEENVIKTISYAKIDAEGADLKILEGADRFLKEQRIEMVEAECSMTPLNTFHARFEDIKKFLEDRGYLLFGLYNQVRSFTDNRAYLRRANAVFMSQKLSDTHECPTE